jgi:hypothetical protein
LYQSALRVFAQLPFAAQIDDSILCAHGGIGSTITDLSCITFFKRPIENFNDSIIASLVWSDPDPIVSRWLDFFFGKLP